jgi:hypothetical protein
MRFKVLVVALLCLLPSVVGAQSINYYPAGGGGAVTAADVERTTVATSGTALEALQTVTLPANSLANVGDFVTIEGVYIGPANGNAKIGRLYHASIAGTNLVSFTTSGSAPTIKARVTCVRTGASTAMCENVWTWSGGANYTVSPMVSLTGLDFGAAMNFVSAGISSVQAGDISAVSTTLSVTKF